MKKFKVGDIIEFPYYTGLQAGEAVGKVLKITSDLGEHYVINIFLLNNEPTWAMITMCEFTLQTVAKKATKAKTILYDWRNK